MSLQTLACIKRVPDTGASISLTPDQQRIDTSGLGFTMSPHEECGIEEAVSIVEEHGGTSTVLTLGPEEAAEQLRTGLAMQADEAILLETDGNEWDPMATAEAIANAVESLGDDDRTFDMLLFGNESADAENYQVGIRVAHQLDLPCVTGIKDLTIEGGTAIAQREIPGGSEIFEVALPAVIAVKEGLNEPRYPSMRSKMQARRQEIERIEPTGAAGGPEKVRLIAPEADDTRAEILGEGPEAAAAVVDVFEELEVI